MPLKPIPDWFIHQARRFACAILASRDSGYKWPPSDYVNEMSAYKTARKKAEMVEYMVSHGWLEVTDCIDAGARQRRYVITDWGREVVALPKPLPLKESDEPLRFPDDEAEYAILSFHYYFFKKHGRWPNGLERSRIFTGSATRRISKERRRSAYKKLREEGTLVKVRYRDTSHEGATYVMPAISPEYEGMDGYLFYLVPNLMDGSYVPTCDLQD